MQEEATTHAPPPHPPVQATGAQPSRATVSTVLEAARNQLLRRAGIERTGLIVTTVAGVAILLATLRALEPAFDVRGAFFPAVLAGVLGLVIAARARRRALDDAAVAAALHAEDRETGAIGISDELRSLLELEESQRAGRLAGDNAFVVLLAARVVRHLSALDFAAVLPVRAARRTRLRRVVVSILAVGLVALVHPRLWPDAWAALRYGAPVDALPPAPPIVGDLELELTPPAYTGLPPRTLPSSGGELRVLRGTQVHVRARSLGRTLRAELLLELDGQRPKRLPVKVSSSTAANPLLEADFTVSAAGRYRFVLWRWTGRVVEPDAHRIELDPDLPPRVELRVPADPLELPVPRPIELAIDAEDDFGLGAIALVYQVDQQKPVRIPLALEQPTPRRARGRYTWETGELEREAPLPPGAKITYWVEAEDDDAVSGKKIGRSRSAVITLRTPAKPNDVDRTTLEALLEASVVHLADRVEKKSSPEPHGALVSLVATWQKAQKGNATESLKRLATGAVQRLDKLAAEEAQGRTVEALVPELEHDILALDDLRTKRRLDDMVRIGNEMKRARDELGRLMTELKTATSDAQKDLLKKEIERKLVELEAKMAELRQAARDSEGEVPDEFLNRDALKKQQLAKQTESIRDLLAKGDLDKAMSELDRMSRSLDQMTKSLEDGQHAQRAEADPAAERAMAGVENDLADLAKDEHAVESEARAIRQQTADKAAQEGGGTKALRDKLRGKLAELDRRAEEETRDGRMLDPDDIAKLRGRAKNVDRALEADDLDEAQQMAGEARRLAQSMSLRLREFMREAEAEQQARVGDGPSAALRRADRHAQEVESLAHQIEQELDKADAQRQPSMSGEQKKRLDELARRQEQLQQKGDELKKRMGQEPGLQGLPGGVGQKLDGARQQMGEAGRQLQRPAPGRGAEAAQQAAEQLDAARKEVADARKGEGGSGRNDGSSPRGDRDEPVRIPGADDSAAPKAFREELLDAMKRGAPKKFEEQVQHFYEELVR